MSEYHCKLCNKTHYGASGIFETCEEETLAIARGQTATKPKSGSSDTALTDAELPLEGVATNVEPWTTVKPLAPYCLGIATIRQLAVEGHMEAAGYAFIAASDLFKHDPYEEIDTLKAEVAIARERLGPAGWKLLQELKELRAEVSKVRDERDYWKKQHAAAIDAMRQVGDERDAARQTCERLVKFCNDSKAEFDELKFRMEGLEK